MQLYSVKTKYKSEHVLLALKYLKVIGIHEHTYRQTLDPHESSITVQHMQYNTIQFDLIKSHDTKHISSKAISLLLYIHNRVAPECNCVQATIQTSEANQEINQLSTRHTHV